jgi:hypothetical protein
MESDDKFFFGDICRGAYSAESHVSLVVEAAGIVEVSDLAKFCQAPNPMARPKAWYRSPHRDPYGTNDRVGDLSSCKGLYLEGETCPFRQVLGTVFQCANNVPRFVVNEPGYVVGGRLWGYPALEAPVAEQKEEEKRKNISPVSLPGKKDGSEKGDTDGYEYP